MASWMIWSMRSARPMSDEPPRRKDHGVFENKDPDLPTCIAELEILLQQAMSPHRIACLNKTIEALARRQDHLDRMGP